MAYLGSVSLVPPRDGVFLGNLSVGNLNLGANEVLYSANGTDIDGSSNFTFDGTQKLHLGESLGFTNTYATNLECVSNANQSTQNIIIQNKNAGTVASANMYITNDSTVSESANFCVIGMNSSTYAGANYVSEKKNGMYIANTDADVAITTNAIGSGAGIHLSGNGGANAISINPNNAISLGSTYNATTDTYTYNCGSSGQVLTSSGAGALPTWTTPSGGITIANQANTRIPFETATSNALDSSANLTFNSATNTLSATNVSLTNINGSAYPSSFVSVANQADNRIITATNTSNALNGEANLSFDGTTLTQGSVNYNVASEAVQITDGALNGNQSVAIGHKARGQASSVSIGYDVGKTGMSGNYNVLIGRSTAIGLTTGNGLVVIGGNAAQAITSGTNNTIVGVSSGAITSTQSNVSIFGYNSRATDTGLIARANCGIFGDGIINVLSGDNEIQIGKSGTTVYTYASATRSDARDKADIRDTELGLNFISKLKPRQYRFNYRSDYKVENADGTITELPNDESKKRNRFHNGFIAQELEQTAQELNIDFAGIKHGCVNGGSDVYNVDYSELIAPMVKAIQELEARIKILETKSI